MSVRSTVVAMAVVGLLTVGCTHARVMSIAAPTPAGNAVGQCTTLMAQLPGSVGGLAKRDTSATPFTAAWGDPLVTLRCGGAVANPDPTASLVDAGGMTWRVRQAGDIVEWLAENRATRVEVRVPASNTAQENVMSDIGIIVRDAIPALPSSSASTTG